jgi:Fe-S cluster assembly iron-binding protein IscA
MALDEPKDDDSVAEEAGIKFLMDNQTADILRQSGGLTIDYVDESYRRGYMLRLGAPGESDCSSGGCNGCG